MLTLSWSMAFMKKLRVSVSSVVLQCLANNIFVIKAYTLGISLFINFIYLQIKINMVCQEKASLSAKSVFMKFLWPDRFHMDPGSMWFHGNRAEMAALAKSDRHLHIRWRLKYYVYQTDKCRQRFASRG